jgi:hypothetical protein
MTTKRQRSPVLLLLRLTELFIVSTLQLVRPSFAVPLQVDSTASQPPAIFRPLPVSEELSTADLAQEAAPIVSAVNEASMPRLQTAADVYAVAYDQCGYAGNVVTAIADRVANLGADGARIKSVQVKLGYGVRLYRAPMYSGGEPIATSTTGVECIEGGVASVDTFLPIVPNRGEIIPQAKVYVVWYGYGCNQ